MECITLVKSSLELLAHNYALLFVSLALLSALVLRHAFFGPIKRFPPGPPPLPIIGHLHLLGKLPHRSLHTLSQSYGPLLGLRLGRFPTIVASSPHMAKVILHTHDLAFAYRPRHVAAIHTCFDCTDVAYSPYGPYWKLLRQLYATELFNAKRLDSFKNVREEEIRAMAHSLLQIGQQGGKAVKIQPCLVTTTRNINFRMVISQKIEESNTKMSSQDLKHEFLNIIEEIMHLLGVFYVGDYIPWLAWLDPRGYLKRMKAAGKKMEAILQNIIDNKRESLREKEGIQTHQHDLLDALIMASQNKHLDIEITDKNIMATMLDLFVGGVDTSAMTVEWTLAELMNNPKVMKKLQEELDNVVGRERLVEESDISNLPYLGSVVKESMRLHPVAPLLIPHESIQECYIGGYIIPAKTQAYVNVWAIGRSSAFWDRPLEFCPERFDHKKFDLRGQHFELLPFGSGRRKCPGWALGFISVHLMLASLVQGFTWDSPISSSVLDMSEKYGLTIRMAKPLCAIATPRLPMHLY